MAEEVTLNQQEVKELLGEFYDENKHYVVSLEAHDDTYAASNPALKIEVEGFDYKIEPGLITTVVKLDVNASDFIDELEAYNKIYNQHVDRFKSLSMYDTLVNKYGFTESDYNNQKFEAIDNYMSDNSDDEFNFHLYATLQEEFRLTEDNVEKLMQDGYSDIYSKSFKILNTNEHITPKLMSELGLGGLMIAEESNELRFYFDLEVDGKGSAYVDASMSCDQ